MEQGMTVLNSPAVLSSPGRRGMVGPTLGGICQMGEGKDWAPVSGPGEERREARMRS